MKSQSPFFPKTIYAIAKSLAIVSGFFLFAISVLLIAHYIQAKTTDPLNHPVLKEWMQKYSENQKDELLKEKIRALDLLARKAYFTSIQQINMGGYLAFLLLVLFVASLKTINIYNKKWIPPSSCKEESEFLTGINARKLLYCSAIFLASLSLLFAWLSQTELSPNLALPSALATEKAIEKPAVQEAVFTPKTIEANWPCFRGPRGHGIAFHQKPPLEWDAPQNKNILWKVIVPKPGYNSPIVWDNQIFLSGSDGNTQEVYSIDAPTGKVLWTKEIKGIPGSPQKPPKVTQDTGYAASSMCTDGENVYAIFTTGDIAALSLQGEIRWSRNLGVPKNHYGHSSSLYFWEGLLLVQYDHDGGPQILALKGKTGETAWKKERDTEISWASPILIEEKNQVLLSASPMAILYNIKTGEEVWQQKCLSGEVGPSPAYSQGMVFVTNVGAGFTALKLETGEIAWEKIEGDFPEASSPVAKDEYVFVASSHGALLCMESATGNVFWEKEIQASFYSSPVIVNDRIYLSSRSGITYILALSKEYSLLASCPLGEPIVTTPAFCHNRIYIRGEKHLFCLEKKE